MYSDDSAASEIASDDENSAFGEGGESGVASEIEESGGRTAKPPPTASTATTAQRAAASEPSEASDAYEDEEYEDYDDGYSVDFEDDVPATPVAKRSMSPVRIPSPAKRPAAISEDAEYYEASFENESRKSMSMSQSARLVVDLSIPTAKDSPTRREAAGSIAKPSSPFPHPNSPHVDLKVLSKPMATTPVAAVPSPFPTYPHHAAPSAAMHIPPGQEHQQHFHPRFAEGEEKKFSLLLRKVESKFEDEVEELREKNTLLQWKERELKTELRMQRDELKMRKSRIEKKRKRALERRREHERMVDKLKAEVKDLGCKVDVLNELNCKLESEKQRVSGVLSTVEAEKRAVEERNLALAEKLQTTLSDFHALNLRFEDTVNAKLDAEKRIDDVISKHRVEIEVMEHKRKLEVETSQKALEQEIARRATERMALPENYRLIVQAEKDRYEKLETALAKQMRELETTVARDALKYESEVAKAWEMKQHAEEKAEKRVQEELQMVREVSCGDGAYNLLVS